MSLINYNNIKMHRFPKTIDDLYTINIRMRRLNIINSKLDLLKSQI